MQQVEARRLASGGGGRRGGLLKEGSDEAAGPTELEQELGINRARFFACRALFLYFFA